MVEGNASVAGGDETHPRAHRREAEQAAAPMPRFLDHERILGGLVEGCAARREGARRSRASVRAARRVAEVRVPSADVTTEGRMHPRQIIQKNSRSPAR